MKPATKKRTSLLSPFPRRTAYDDIHTAIRGASYHLNQLNKTMKRVTVLPDRRGLKLDHVELFHWHLRAFFWELVAIRDILRRPRNPIPTLSQTLETQPWFIEVNTYRNFTHESLHVVEIIIGESGPIGFQLQPAISGQHYEDGAAQLNRYWNNMKTFIEMNIAPNKPSLSAAIPKRY